MTSTSGPVVAGRYASTLWTYPLSGTFAADRAALIGNTSGADGDVGTNIGRVFTLPPVTNYRNQPVGLDGTDTTDTVFDEQTVIVPVVIYETDLHAALVEWRRIVAAVSPRHRRAALEVWDPNSIGQKSRWLTRLVLDDMTDLGLEHDQQNYFVGRLVFVTDGEPWWTPEPLNVNRISNLVQPTDNSVYQLTLSNTGTEDAWPLVEWNDLAGNSISLTLASTGKTTDIVDTLTGSGEFDFNRRTRDPATDKLINPGSTLFRIPPGSQRVDVVIGNGTPGPSAQVTISFLPRHSTA